MSSSHENIPEHQKHVSALKTEAPEATSTVWNGHQRSITNNSPALQISHPENQHHDFRSSKTQSQLELVKTTTTKDQEASRFILGNTTGRTQTIMFDEQTNMHATVRVNKTPKSDQSEDSSYQYDFYERSAPTNQHVHESYNQERGMGKPVDALQVHTNLSDEGSESGLSSNSEQGNHQLNQTPQIIPTVYGTKNGGNITTPGNFLTSKSENTDDPIQQMVITQSNELEDALSGGGGTGGVLPIYPFRNSAEESDGGEDDEDDEGEDDYESSEDEFQKELKFMAMQHQQLMEKERSSQVPQNNHDTNQHNQQVENHNPSVTKPEIENYAEHSMKQESHVQELSENPVPENDPFPKRESISGLSEHPTPVVPTNGSETTAIIAFVTTTSHDGESDLHSKLLPNQDDGVAMKTKSDKSDKVMSRGDPDGMPTQRNVNTGGSGKAAFKIGLVVDQSNQVDDSNHNAGPSNSVKLTVKAENTKMAEPPNTPRTVAESNKTRSRVRKEETGYSKPERVEETAKQTDVRYCLGGVVVY